MKKNILVIGGTGLVGQKIIKMLSNDVPQYTIYTGSRKQNLDDSTFLKIDVQEPQSLTIIAQKNIHLIVLCASDPSDNVLKYCIKHKIDYIDITKPTSELAAAYALVKSQQIDSKIVFSSGWMGGIVSSMAYALHSNFDVATLYISYSLNDLAGESTTHFIAENVTKRFSKYVNGNKVETKHFLNPQQNDFAFGIGIKTAYDFDIPELFIFHKIEKIPSVSVKMTYDSDLVSKVLYWLQKVNFFALLSYSMKRKMFNASGKGDRVVFEVVVEKDGIQKKMSLRDIEGQSHLTAFSTVLHIKKMLETSQKGVFFSHQLHQPQEVVAQLSAQSEIEIR